MKLHTAKPLTQPSSFLPFLRPSPRLHRHLSSTTTAQIPPPTPFVPDSKTFLSLIGRNLSAHAAKIPTWTALFTLSSEQLRKLGVEPARTRRYLLWWRERFRKGDYGIGGDMKEVRGSVATVRAVEVVPAGAAGPAAAAATTTTRRRKIVVNVPVGAEEEVDEVRLRGLEPVKGLKVLGAGTVAGPFVEPVKGTGGSVAAVRAQEGMWEQRRGVKIDGGERRKVMVRRKRKLEEMKKARV
ncbi:MAG: hypothetical protein LQ344_005558 [Seirophora lacunosa]|nr:MAG: hypothetical protein LQ344_005558 [Seirophora lacunosa]